MRGVNSAHDGLSMPMDTGRKPSPPVHLFHFSPKQNQNLKVTPQDLPSNHTRKHDPDTDFVPILAKPQKKTYSDLLPSSNLLTFALLKKKHVSMTSIAQSNIRQTWLESLLWIFFLTNILQNQSVIFSIVGTAVYALLVAGALLSASYTFKKLKADRRQLSRNHCACLIILILSCLGYTLTYVVVGLRQLL